MNDELNIKDDEIRIIGSDEPCFDSFSDRRLPTALPVPVKAQRRHVGLVWIIAGAVVLLVLAFISLLGYVDRKAQLKEVGLFEGGEAENVYHEYKSGARIGNAALEKKAEEPLTLGDYSDTSGLAYTETVRKIINDIPLTVYIPHNAVPELCLTAPDYRDGSIILAAQAADIRRDNKKIVGAFVLKGAPLAWGLSKKGYCSIIDGKLTVGVADNSPLFEEATEKEGYFFRQYPLVDNGRLVENEPKNKSLRKALCERAGEIFVVRSETPESFHDFAQALVDLGVNNAIYLVGSTSYGFWYDRDGAVTEFSDLRNSGYRYESYILWRKGRE